MEVTKFLGILIDNNLSWKSHTNDITKIVSKYNVIIRKVRPFLNKDSPHTLYNTLVLPHLSYYTIVWGDKNNSNLDSLCITQKKIIRKCTNSIWLEHTTPLFLSLKNFKRSVIFIFNNLQSTLITFTFSVTRGVTYIANRHRSKILNFWSKVGWNTYIWVWRERAAWAKNKPLLGLILAGKGAHF